MSEFKIPANESDFNRNFAALKPAMNETEAHYESSRCLFCYDAPCMNACPTHIDIPLFIRQISLGNLTGAANTIFDANYLGHACGKVCPTEVLCEGACVYNHQQVKPIEIGRLQSFATAATMSSQKVLFEPGSPNGKKVAVIGAGPAGIACACELRRLGYEVVIYESKSQPSGLTIYGVAPYKITNEEAGNEVEWLQRQLGFEIKFNEAVTNSSQIGFIEKGYDAVMIGIGLGATRDLRIHNEKIDHVWGATEFIEKLRMEKHEVQVGKKVIVIGAGNTAMDAASESARMGAEQVILAYRGTRDEMSAYDFEYELAKSVGVKSLFQVQPVEFLGIKKVTAVKFARTRREQGKTVLIEGSEFVEPCDMVIRATGQVKQRAFFNMISGLETDEAGRIRVNDLYQTTNAKYFAAGDCVNGGKEVVNAVAEGKMAAQGIHRVLSKAAEK